MPSRTAHTLTLSQRRRGSHWNGSSSAPGSRAAQAPSARRHPTTHFGAKSQQSHIGLTRTPQSVLALQFAESDCAAWAHSILFERQPRPRRQPTIVGPWCAAECTICIFLRVHCDSSEHARPTQKQQSGSSQRLKHVLPSSRNELGANWMHTVSHVFGFLLSQICNNQTRNNTTRRRYT